MSKICPECGSDRIMTERRPDGYHICRNCCFYWRNEEAPKQTVFEQITQSKETLAEKLVYAVSYHWEMEFRYTSNLIPGHKRFDTKAEAIAATLMRLNEVVK